MYVGNLSYETTQDELVELLSAAGKITDVHLPTDRLTGRPRGFAFVEFSSEAEMSSAVERFNGYSMGQRSLRVTIAEDRAPPSREPNRSFGAPPKAKSFKAKGSRRRLRARKRSL